MQCAPAPFSQIALRPGEGVMEARGPCGSLRRSRRRRRRRRQRQVA